MNQHTKKDLFVLLSERLVVRHRELWCIYAQVFRVERLKFMFKVSTVAALVVASGTASAFAGSSTFAQVVAELNATAIAGAQGSAVSVGFTHATPAQQGFAPASVNLGNQGKVMDLTNVLDGAGLSPSATVKPGSWALRGDAFPTADANDAMSPSGPNPVAVIPLPSAVGLTGAGLLVLAIRRRSGM
jgi:hypothetical protein